MTYNLLVERWIPVLWSDGKFGRVGIKEALTEAGRIRQIAANNPMDRMAVLRFLLVLLYWCKGNPPNGALENLSGAFPADWFSKLDENKECFNLLGDGKRFYQEIGARRQRPSTDLIQEIPTGNNFWHFRHSTDGEEGLCPACCAMGLLRLPMFSVSGLPNMKAGINGTPPLYVIRLETSLLDTLLANWRATERFGEPSWVRSGVCADKNEDVPLLAGLTLPARRVWLHEPSEPPGRCVSCGQMEVALIRTCEFQTAGEQKTDKWTDPHVVYLDVTPRKALKAVDLTAARKFKMDRPWANELSRIIEIGSLGASDRPTALFIVGFATDQAKYIDVWERVVTLPPKSAIQQASPALLQQWLTGWNLLGKRVARAKDEGAAAISAIRPHVEAKVSARACELLSGGDLVWEEAAREYAPMLEIVAKSLAPGFTTTAVQKRRSIARAASDMRPSAKPATKPARKKGGKK
jgi:hypothetical protein